MDSIRKKKWKQLAGLFPPDSDQEQHAASLYREYETRGRLSQSASELLDEPLPVIADFFRRICLMHSSESPISRRRNSRWVSEYDYTYLNIRAAGTKKQSGNFLSAAFFLTTLNSGAVILAPVTTGSDQNLLFVDSHIKIRDDLLNIQARKAGIEAEDQMALFCEAAHALNIALGFDLDYRVSAGATVVLKRPELFFWVKDGEFNPEENIQQELRKKIRESLKKVQNVDSSEWTNLSRSLLEKEELKVRLSKDGTGRAALAFWSYYSGGNRTQREAAISYWSRIFNYWRDHFVFDFILLRGTSVLNDRDNFEHPGLDAVVSAVDTIRKKGVRRNIGIMAEGSAPDLETLGSRGVDLTLTSEVHKRVDKQWFKEVLDIHDTLERINTGRKHKFTIPILIDPGNSGSPSKRERTRMIRFVARFFSTASSRRPILETMGASEGAWGYQQSLSLNQPMNWVSDISGNHAVRCLENIARQNRNLLQEGSLEQYFLDNHMAWWVLKSGKGLVIAVMSIENDDMLPPGEVSIDYSPWYNNVKTPVILEYDFTDSRGFLSLTSSEKVIRTGSMPYRSYKLYTVL